MAPEHLWVSAEAWQAMLRHVRSCVPEEACGLLGGVGGRAILGLPIENQSHSTIRFRMEPAAQVRAMMDLERAGHELLGIYHSHPSGPSSPSDTDTAEAAYPEIAYLVWSPSGQCWWCEAFAFDAGKFRPMRLEREAA
jgi:proteasome lid subunit RPN8/RPN11